MLRFRQRWLPRSPRAWLGLAALLVLTGAAAGAAWWIAPPYYHLHAADLAMRQYDWDGARRHLDACLQSWPSDADVHMQAARAARHGGDCAEADRQLAACERLRGVTAADALERALVKAQQGDLPEVEAPLLAQADENPAAAVDILDALARGYLATDRVPRGRECLDRLLDLRPDYFPALVLRGQLFEAKKDDEGAERSYGRAVAARPDSAVARLKWADALKRLGRAREAAGQYEYLRRLQPASPELLVGLARCRVDLSDRAEARRLLDEILAGHPDYVPALVERGRLAIHEGDLSAAEKSIRRALALAPSDRDALGALFRCLKEEGRDDEARQVRADLGRIEADWLRVDDLKGETARSAGDPNLLCEIGTTLLNLGEDEEGLRWLSLALERDPRHPRTHAALADYYERIGRADEAARHRAAAPK